MTEPAATADPQEPAAPSSAQPATSACVRAPRAPLFDAVLHFSTFGLYTAFWMVARVREIKQIGEVKLRPWLWFFVPAILLAQLFALPKLAAIIKDIEQRNNLPQWRNSGLWVAGVAGMTLVFSITDKIDFPFALSFLALLVWSSLFGVLQARINGIKNALPSLCFKGKRKGYSVVEWLVVVPLAPSVLSLMLYGSIEPLLVKELTALPAGTTYADPEGHFSLSISGSDWKQVEIGTHSDDDAILELQGPSSNVYFVVFHHGYGQDLDSLSRFRQEGAFEEFSGMKCQEKRRFARKQLSVVSVVTCDGRFLGDPVTRTSTFIETENGVYELYGHLMGARLSHGKSKQMILEMAQGFEPG